MSKFTDNRIVEVIIDDIERQVGYEPDKQMSDISENAVQNKVIKKYVDDADSKKLDKTGGEIGGNLDIKGDLTVEGKTTSKSTETLLVKDNIIVTNSDKTVLFNLSGLAINKNSDETYGIMYDPTDDSVKLGFGTIDENNNFIFKESANPIAVRASSNLFVDGHLIVWDAQNNRFIDSGKSLDDIDVATDNKTITKNTKKELQAIALKKENDEILTAEDIWLACSIERTV